MTVHTKRIAIITGASRGFGLATARTLANTGWSLIIDARGSDALEAVITELGHNTEVVGLDGDVTDPEHWAELIAAAQAWGGLDLVINNASTLGPSPRPPLADYPIEELARVFEVNVLAPLALTQAALPLLRPRRGVVVNITSDAGREQYAGWGGYGSSKAALDQLSNVLAAEEPDLSVYWFDPGDMNTQMHQEAFPGEDISDRPPPEASVSPLLHLIEKRPASGRYGASEMLSKR